MKNKNSSIEKMVNEMTKSFHKSINELVNKMSLTPTKKEKKTTSKIEAEPKQSKTVAGSNVFLDVLKFIGRPSTTREIAGRLKMVHPEIKLPKLVLMQQLYNSASYLNKEGLINKHPVGKRQFEYSISESAEAIQAA